MAIAQRCLLFMVLLLLAGALSANSCFNFAATYYQQLYCEIQASGKGAGLPSFTDFRRNNEQMQALLLKPYARKAGLEIHMPRSSKTARTPPVATADSEAFAAESDRFVDCQVDTLTLRCAAGNYQLVRNQRNDQLADEVLSNTFKMALPIFRGDAQQASAVNTYLAAAYEHYLQKMIAIGLGGSTMRYGKFAYLFADLNDKGLDFSQRFEKMFSFLKADKRKLRVPVRSAIPAGLDVKQCFALGTFVLCPMGQFNLVFTPL